MSESGSYYMDSHHKLTWQPGQSECKVQHSFTIPVPGTEGAVIYNPAQLICATVGVLTGLSGFLIFLSNYRGYVTDVNRRVIYALTFLTFACMNVTGLFNFCFFPPKVVTDAVNPFQVFVFILDGTFSSITSLNFGYMALADKGILKPATVAWHRALVVLSYFVIVFSFSDAFLGDQSRKWLLAFVWVFFYVFGTLVGSVFYFTQTLHAMRSSGNYDGLGWLVSAAAVGISGLFGLQIPFVQTWLCDVSNSYVSGLVLWYAQSDYALAGLMVCVIKHQSYFANLQKSQLPKYSTLATVTTATSKQHEFLMSN